MTTATPQPIGQTLQAWRKAHNLTQVQAAAALGVPVARILNWEQGTRTPRPYVATLLREKMNRLETLNHL